MSKNTKNNVVGAADSGESVLDGLEGWVMLEREQGSYFDSDSESEGESEGEFLDPRLLEAAMTNRPKNVNKLLGQKADPNFQNKQGHTALSQAVPPPAEPKKDDNNRANIRSDPQKIQTKIQDNIAIIKALLEAKANPNIIIQDGNTVLHYAAEKYNTEVAKLLLDHKADVNIRNNQGQFPSDCVKTYCDTSLARLLQPTQKSLDLQLIEAIKTKNHKQVEYLIKEKADPNIRDGHGREPLTRAIMNNDPEMVELLIKNKANVTTRNNYQPLYYAARFGYKAIITTLIKNSVNIAHLNKDDVTEHPK